MTATVSSTPSKPSKQAVPTLRHVPPGWIGRIVAALATAAVLAYPLLSDDLYYQNMIILSLVFAIGASGLNIISGFAGYVSLGQGAFIGLGGYTIGVLATKFDRRRRLAVGARGRPGRRGSSPSLLGLVSLRSRGPAFVIITVAFLFLMHRSSRSTGSRSPAARPGCRCRCPTWGLDIINWPFYYALVGDPGAAAADDLVDPAHQVRHGPDRDPRGRDQGRDDRHQPAGATRCSASWPARVFVGMAGAVYGYYLTFIDPRGMFNILISVQIVLSLLRRRQGDAVGAGARRVPHRAAQRVRQQQPSAAATRGCSSSAGCWCWW